MYERLQSQQSEMILTAHYSRLHYDCNWHRGRFGEADVWCQCLWSNADGPSFSRHDHPSFWDNRQHWFYWRSCAVYVRRYSNPPHTADQEPNHSTSLTTFKHLTMHQKLRFIIGPIPCVLRCRRLSECSTCKTGFSLYLTDFVLYHTVSRSSP